MTVEVSTAGPGNEVWRSSKFSLTVNGGSPAYVYGYSRDSQLDCSVWAAGDTVEQSWFGLGADEETTVAISLVSGSITSAVVYPKDAGVTQSIAAGVLTLTVPTNVRLRVEVNGDRAEVLSLFSSPIQDAPGDFVDFTTTVKTVTAVGTGVNPGTITIPSHGYGAAGTFFRALVRSTDSLPTASRGVMEEHEAVVAVVVDSDTLSLVDSSGTILAWSDAGTGTLTLSLASLSTGTLYFGAGVHEIGRLFRLETGTSVYLHRDALVIGSFDMANSTGVSISGPGVISGTYVVPEKVWQLPLTSKYQYAIFYGSSAATTEEDNTISDVTVFGQPHFLNYFGVRSFRNVHAISPWNYSTDGFAPQATSTSVLTSEVVDCYALIGDDALKIRNKNRAQRFEGCFVTVTNNGCFQHFSVPVHGNTGLYATVTNCHAMHLGRADIEGGGSGLIGSKVIWKAITDGYESQSSAGHFNFVVYNLNVWGPLECRLFVIGNLPNPFPGTWPVRELYGQVSNLDLRNIVCEEVPGQLSLITGLNATNTPHDIVIAGLSIGGTDVDSDNASTFITINPFVYNLQWLAATTTVGGGATFVVEDGTGVAGANSYASAAFGDTYYLNRGNPTAWAAASVASKRDALRIATAYLDDVYGGRYRGIQVSTTQTLRWPRAGARDADTGFIYGSNEIPTRLQEAAVELAYRHLTSVTLRPDITAGDGGIKSSSLSIAGLSFNDSYSGTQSTQPRFPVIDSKLRGILSSASGSMVRLSR